MDEACKIVVTNRLVGEDGTSESLICTYLLLAGEKILDKAYPFGREKKAVPDKYAMLQCEIAAYLLNKRGAEGELTHSENGISRTYEAASVPDSMLKAVIPFVGAIG